MKVDVTPFCIFPLYFLYLFFQKGRKYKFVFFPRARAHHSSSASGVGRASWVELGGRRRRCEIDEREAYHQNILHTQVYYWFLPPWSSTCRQHRDPKSFPLSFSPPASARQSPGTAYQQKIWKCVTFLSIVHTYMSGGGLRPTDVRIEGDGWSFAFISFILYQNQHRIVVDSISIEVEDKIITLLFHTALVSFVHELIDVHYMRV